MTLTTVAHYGKVAQAMNQVQQQKPANGEAKGSIACPKCGGKLSFAIQSTGISRGLCSCGIRWCQ